MVFNVDFISTKCYDELQISRMNADEENERKEITMLHVNSWLNQAEPANHIKGNEAFEQRLTTLRAAVRQRIDASVTTQLWDLEQAAFASVAKPSRQQQARFFFLGGQIYEQLQQKRMAHQYYGLCERRLQSTENAPLLVLHMTWAPVSEKLHYPLCSLHSYSEIVRLLQTRQSRESTMLAAPWLQHYQKELIRCRLDIVEHGVSHSPMPLTYAARDMPPSFE